MSTRKQTIEPPEDLDYAPPPPSSKPPQKVSQRKLDKIAKPRKTKQSSDCKVKQEKTELKSSRNKTKSKKDRDPPPVVPEVKKKKSGSTTKPPKNELQHLTRYRLIKHKAVKHELGEIPLNLHRKVMDELGVFIKQPFQGTNQDDRYVNWYKFCTETQFEIEEAQARQRELEKKKKPKKNDKLTEREEELLRMEVPEYVTINPPTLEELRSMTVEELLENRDYVLASQKVFKTDKSINAYIDALELENVLRRRDFKEYKKKFKKFYIKWLVTADDGKRINIVSDWTNRFKYDYNTVYVLKKSPSDVATYNEMVKKRPDKRSKNNKSNGTKH